MVAYPLHIGATNGYMPLGISSKHANTEGFRESVPLLPHWYPLSVR